MVFSLLRIESYLPGSLISLARPVVSSVMEVIVNTSAPAGSMASTFWRASAALAASTAWMPLALSAFKVRSMLSLEAGTFQSFIVLLLPFQFRLVTNKK
jgi:hypothetical protein